MTLRLHLIIYIVLGVALSANAQTDRVGSINRGAVRFVPGSALLQTNPATGMSWQTEGTPFNNSLTSAASPDIYPTPSKGYGEDTGEKNKAETKGELHGSVSLSVIAGFGKGAPKGAGFAQDINLDYTTYLGKRTWLTVGGYMSHLNWSGINTTSAGIYGALGYDINEHFTAYVYGQKSLANTGMGGYGYPAYYGYWGFPGTGMRNGYGLYNPFADRLGAALRWTPSRTLSIEVSVEKDWMPHNNHGYNRQYDYQK